MFDKRTIGACEFQFGNGIIIRRRGSIGKGKKVSYQ